MLSSSMALSPTGDEKISEPHIIRDSFEMELQVSGGVGTQGIPCSKVPSPTSYMPVDWAISTFGTESQFGRPADPLCIDFVSKPISKSLPIDTQEGLSGLEGFAGGTRGIVATRTPSSHMSSVEVPALVSGRPSILVVDDEFLYRDLIADILGDEYEILFAAHGMAALETAVVTVPDLILLDLMMPGIDGFEVYKCLKADQRTCEIPVIFITGRGDVAAETMGLKMGAVDYISKPINAELVRARVNMQIRFKLMRDKLAQLAATDGLTGLANRSHFDNMLSYEHARHLRSGNQLSLIMLDIDHFKAFNDTYGHVRGDQCLREIARALAKTLSRATDLVARYGGEEFVVLLPETPLKGAVILAEKVRNCITYLDLPHRDSATGYVTASLGVVSGRLLAGSSIMDVVHAADIELYAAKAGGRNRVSFRAMDSFGLTH